MFKKILNIWLNNKKDNDYYFFDNIVRDIYIDEFYHALYEGDVQLAKSILHDHYIPYDIKFDFYDHYGNEYKNVTPMHVAVIGNHLNAVKFLLENGFDINQLDDKMMTPLDYAKKMNHQSIERYLNSKLFSDNYLDLLIKSIEEKDSEKIVEYLNMDHEYPHCDINGKTILSYANGDKDIIDLLKKYGFKSKLELENDKNQLEEYEIEK